MLTGRKDPDLGRGEVSFMERETSCCFTGHRRISPQDGLWLRRMLRQEILRMAQEGVRSFLAGGALGFDTMAAQEVLRMRAEYLPDLELVLVLPCVGQEEKWRQRDAAVYRVLLRQADQVIYTGTQRQKGCMFRRNRFLVDHSAYCICYQVTQRGGTAYTVQYARNQGLQVSNLAEKV